MLIRVVTCFSQKSDEVLELFDLVKIVDESFRNLLDQEWAIRNFIFNLLLGSLKSFGILAHLLRGDSFGDLALTLKRSLVAHKCRRALNSLLQAILLNEALNLLLELALLSRFLFFHLCTAHRYVSIMLLSR